jgi:phytoene dehydrogenase-like protein
MLERGRDAPSELSFREWAGRRFGEEAAAAAAAASGVGVFHPDPGELSAAFVWPRLKRVFGLPPAARYRRGAWGEIFVDLATLARSLGVPIELGSRVDAIESGVTIVATQLESARRLLGDDRLVWPSGRTALLDLSLQRRRGDPFVVSDLDGTGWLECFSIPDSGLCPLGESLFQLQVPTRADEPPLAGTAAAEALADLALPRWRDRMRFRRTGFAHQRTGAVDYPGYTWRDRPAIDRGEGVYLVGDQVAAPGLLSEVSFNSAVAAGGAAAELATGVARGPSRSSHRP